MTSPSNDGITVPTPETGRDRPLLDTSGAGGGCGCRSPAEAQKPADPAPEATTAAPKENEMTTHTYAVTGMTCGHCASAVTSELTTLDGVTDVTVDLVAGGTSSVTVTSTQPLDRSQVAAAVDEAGDYRLA